jgi:hypothetical protein
MVDIETCRRIDSARDILVGKVPDPKAQVCMGHTLVSIRKRPMARQIK